MMGWFKSPVLANTNVSLTEGQEPGGCTNQTPTTRTNQPLESHVSPLSQFLGTPVYSGLHQKTATKGVLYTSGPNVVIGRQGPWQWRKNKQKLRPTVSPGRIDETQGRKDKAQACSVVDNPARLSFSLSPARSRSPGRGRKACLVERREPI